MLNLVENNILVFSEYRSNVWVCVSVCTCAPRIIHTYNAFQNSFSAMLYSYVVFFLFLFFPRFSCFLIRHLFIFSIIFQLKSDVVLNIILTQTLTDKEVNAIKGCSFILDFINNSRFIIYHGVYKILLIFLLFFYLLLFVSKYIFDIGLLFFLAFYIQSSLFPKNILFVA